MASKRSSCRQGSRTGRQASAGRAQAGPEKEASTLERIKAAFSRVRMTCSMLLTRDAHVAEGSLERCCGPGAGF